MSDPSRADRPVPNPADQQSPADPPAPDAAGLPAPDPADRQVAEHLADGEWHRLHPATPLLRGGIALVAILGVVIANLRERIVDLFIPGAASGNGNGSRDPFDFIIDNGYLAIALAALAALLIVLIAGFWLSWRMHTFRITEELVEVRSGILFRTNRRGRLDRIQGINISRPLFARLFGAARLEVNVAGQDANVQLAYLGGGKADALRAEILRIASGARGDGAGGSQGSAERRDGAGNVVEKRVAEFLAPELDPALAQPESVIKMSPVRLIASTLLSSSTLVIVLVVVAAIVAMSVTGEFWALFALIPTIFGIGSYMVNRIVKSLRYSIAATPDGVRVGFGLLSTSNETLPPGRVHSVSVSQPLFWRPADWWEVKVNRASSSSMEGAAGRQNTSILPVGTRADALKVLELVLPSFVDDETRGTLAAGLATGQRDDGFTTSPRRAAVLRWFSWRRNGFVLRRDAVLLRRGAIWRELVVVPTPRTQSVAVRQGPLLRRLRLASVSLHTVAGPISAELGALDVEDASRFFRDAAAAGVAAAAADRSHRWRSGEAPA